jgi:hypothetical protein
VSPGPPRAKAARHIGRRGLPGPRRPPRPRALGHPGSTAVRSASTNCRGKPSCATPSSVLAAVNPRRIAEWARRRHAEPKDRGIDADHVDHRTGDVTAGHRPRPGRQGRWLPSGRSARRCHPAPPARRNAQQDTTRPGSAPLPPPMRRAYQVRPSPLFFTHRRWVPSPARHLRHGVHPGPPTLCWRRRVQACPLCRSKPVAVSAVRGGPRPFRTVVLLSCWRGPDAQARPCRHDHGGAVAARPPTAGGAPVRSRQPEHRSAVRLRRLRDFRYLRHAEPTPRNRCAVTAGRETACGACRGGPCRASVDHAEIPD